ncbi:chalcone isomerase family protein [Pararoseomonas indoligenes]|uniref:Chalcone isomerase family protein n=1 Tax=Roseomonas indoligenes TaxID=2820811 RepID=A0A940MV79_9PROT|nr:chalcone isomerase family protein [Pararoseomonas indoligenes]MBP0491364.1 chalcone isomerase family protein [Pararoseomonas indoligenes]
MMEDGVAGGPFTMRPHPSRRTLAPLALAAVVARPALAQEMPAFLDVAGRRLVLNGTGVRRFLAIPVIRGALYLERRSSDDGAILASPGVKVLRLRYEVSVPRSRLVSGWEDGFREGCGCEMPADFRARLRDLPSGQVEEWLFLPDHGEIAYAGEAPVRVTAHQGRMMLASFIGPDSSSEGLRRGLLGLS